MRFDPSPTLSSIENPGVERHGSLLPLETHSFIMHDPTLNSECHWWPANIQEMIWGFFLTFPRCLWHRLKSGWSSLVVSPRKRKKKSLGWTLGFSSPETLSVIFVWESFFCKCATPSHYSLFWGDRKASRKTGYLFKTENWMLGGFLNQKIKWYFCLKKRWFQCHSFQGQI